ncbi:hypothetical protein ACHAWF_007355 [Thalassiosira exigua]
MASLRATAAAAARRPSRLPPPLRRATSTTAASSSPPRRRQRSTARADAGRHRRRHPSGATAQQRRSASAYGFGQQWTGALSRGPSRLSLEEAPELTPEEIAHFGECQCQSLVPLLGPGEEEGDEEDGGAGSESKARGGRRRRKCVGAAAGWGHTALLTVDDDEGGGDGAPRLEVCGRPHDFQALMRLRRLPPFVRDFCVRRTLPEDDDDDASGRGGGDRPPSMLQRIASYFAGENENEATLKEAKCRRYSNVPRLIEVALPDGEVPAVEGEALSEAARSRHGEEGAGGGPLLHSRFQTTLAASAGVTAVVSSTGTLYTFGLNHRGQCGSGSFSPNVWTPGRVAGLASSRFIMDRGGDAAMGSGGEKKGEKSSEAFREQEHPVVSVALGLQHGVALDAAGQVFCWGKGERGQLGQGRKPAAGKEAAYEEELENRTFDRALRACNFHDPSATAAPSPEDAYAPLLSPDDARVRLISAGMNFSAAVTESNLPYVWGKNVSLNPHYSASGINVRSKPTMDSPYPRYVPGLPAGVRIERVACGTHHAAMLLEDGSAWAVGVATDRPVPLWGEAVEILAPGLVDARELVSFTAGFDRTSIVFGGSGGGGGRRQAIEVQLWSTEDLRQRGAVWPSWMDWLEGRGGGRERVRSVHRGWMHSIVVTQED